MVKGQSCRKKGLNRSKRAISQRKRRAKEKVAELLTAGITDTPREKELVALSDADIKKEPLHDVYQDTDLGTSMDISTIQELSSLDTDHQYNQSFMNKDVKYIHTSSITVTAVDGPRSPQIASHNSSYTPPVVSNNNVFRNTTKRKSQSVYNCNATQTANSKPAPKQTTVKGRRIIDFEYFFNALKSINKHSLSGCSLNDMIITNEKKRGLHASYHLKCAVCKFEHILWTECPEKFKNINTDTVAGMLSINCNFWFMNKILLKMNLPRLSRAVFVTEQDKISSDEVEGGIKITDESLKFPIIDKECEKTQKQESMLLENLISVSSHKNISYQQVNLNRSLIENKQKSRPLKTQMSASLHKNKSYQQVNLNRLLIEDEFEIERNNAYCASEPELVLPHDIELKKSSDNLVTATEEATFDIIGIKQKINSDVYDDKLTRFKNSEMEILNNDSFIGRADTSKVMLSQQENVRACEDKIIVDKKNKLHKTLLKHENQNDRDSCQLEFSDTAHEISMFDFS